VLEANFAERVTAEPELLAQHFTDAGLFEKAVRWWHRAGERAIERSANLEAMAHLKLGIEILGRLPAGGGRDEQELRLHAALMVPFQAREGYASVGLERATSRVIELGERIGAGSPGQLQVVWAHMSLAAHHEHRGAVRTAMALAEAAIRAAERLGDPLIGSHARHRLGHLHVLAGDPAAARRYLEEGLLLYDPERHRTKAASLGFDVCMACHAWLGLALWQGGFPAAALRHAEEAIAAGRAAAHPLSEVYGLPAAAILHQWRGEATLCLERSQAALALATEQVLPFFAAIAMVLASWALVKEGQTEKGVSRLHAGLQAYRTPGGKVRGPHWLALLAEACLAAGRIEDGLSAVREALVETEETEARYYEAELNRLEGELLLASKTPDESRAEASFRKAIAVASAQQAKSWELRAATSLASLLARQGRREEAQALLAPVYGWFTEGFDTADLIAAKALLEQLAP
jgi:predicted ATPase